MFVVGLGMEKVMLGVNRSENFMSLLGGSMGGHQWAESQVQVTAGWHTFTYYFSRAITRLYAAFL